MQPRSLNPRLLLIATAIIVSGSVACLQSSGDQLEQSDGSQNRPAQKAPDLKRIPLRPVGHATADTPYSYFSKACANAYASGNYALAEQLCTEAIADLRKQKITDSRLALALANLASVKRQQHQYEISDKLYKNALGFLKAQPKPDNDCLQYIIKQYAGLLRKMEHTTQANFILENPQAVLDSVPKAGALAGWAREDNIQMETALATKVPQGFQAGEHAGAPPDTQSNMQSNTQPDAQPTPAESIKQIADHDVVLIIDKSGSMDTRDCPNGLTRWEWCAEQMRMLTAETRSCFPKGLTVVVFSDDFRVYQNTTISEVSDIFEFNHPEGGTNTESALEDQLNEYFSRRSLISTKPKPLLIAIVTDGEPNRPARVAETILNAEERMDYPEEISITFLQVGSDIWGTIQLARLHAMLEHHRYGYDIAHAMSFDELQRIGLLGGIARAVTEARAASASK